VSVKLGYFPFPLKGYALMPEKTPLLSAYATARAALEKYRDENYSRGTPVMVNCNRYVGPGLAVRDAQCPLDQVAVVLENGNVWWYPLESVQPSAETPQHVKLQAVLKLCPN
jgi:hypothetical protein